MMPTFPNWKRFAGANDPAVDRRITSLAFVIRAVCRALGKFPILNSTLDENSGEIIFHRYVNVGIGVDTPRGLVAPVIHNADRMGVGEIADHLQVITDNARNASFAIEDTRRHLYDLECGRHGTHSLLDSDHHPRTGRLPCRWASPQDAMGRR